MGALSAASRGIPVTDNHAIEAGLKGPAGTRLAIKRQNISGKLMPADLPGSKPHRKNPELIAAAVVFVLDLIGNMLSFSTAW